MSDFDKDILRWVLLIGAAPIWWPFLRTLWSDFNAALREEGGLFGRAPTPRELDRIRGEASERVETLTSEPYVRAGERRRTRLGAPATRARASATGKPASTAPRNTSSNPSSRRRHFR
jgi:hypothetical protein